jgi:hypothetical protein
MKKWLFLSCLLSVNLLSAQRLDQITIDPLDIPEFKPSGEPTVVIDDLKLWFCGKFLVDIPVLVRANKDISTMGLRIIGGEILNFGRTNEFLIKPDTSGAEYDIKLIYQEKTFTEAIHYIPDPEMKVLLGGQVIDGAMFSLTTAKSTNLLQFEGTYQFEDDLMCYPIPPELMVDGQVELVVRGAVKQRIEFERNNEVNIEELLTGASPGSQLRITQKICLVEGSFVNYRFPAIYTVVLLMN